ncbi:MAG: response regulator [Deltaproteobacteria bacterium]|nr:response regulator [Deltaproteobacteria bacterium]
MENTILFVDDEAVILRALQMVFTREGYHTLTATSGEEALRILEDEEVDVVISDEKMPGLSGIELLSRVKEKYPDKIRIILTAFAEINTVLSAINQVEAHRLIIKPYRNDELVTTVRELLARLKQKRANEQSLAAANRESEFAYRATRIICCMDLSLRDKYRRILKLMEDYIQARTLSLMILHPEKEELVVQAASNERLLGLRKSLSENSIASYVVREKKLFHKPEGERYPHGFSHHDNTVSRYQSDNFLSVPVMDDQRIVGVFNITDPVSGKITSGTEETVSHLMRWVGVMVHPSLANLPQSDG